MLPAFGWQAVVTRWEFAPVVTAAAVVVAALYLWGVWRVARRHRARPWPWWRTAMFAGGLAVVVIATQSGIGAYDDVLFWDHMIQHLLLLMIAPPMLVAGQPVTLLLHASRNPLHTWAKRVIRSRVVGFLTWPAFGLVAYLATIVGTHLTSLAHEIHVNETLHNAEHVLYLVVGYLFFLPLIGREPIRWRVSYPIRVLIFALAMPVDTFSGLILGFQGSSFADGVVGLPTPPGSPGPVEDVHWAGATMWIGGDAIMFGFMILVVLLWSRDDRTSSFGGSFLERVRTSNFDTLVGQPAPAATGAGSGGPGTPGGVTGSGTDPGDPADAPAAPRRVASGRSGIDDDEHLAAYNDYLARLHAASSERDHTSH
jgi:putative copper resistance protein D